MGGRNQRNTHDYYKALARHLGARFNARLRGASYAAWIAPHQALVDRFCFRSTGLKHAYVSAQIKRLWRIPALAQQAADDGLDNVGALIVFFGADPRTLRRALGKSVWRRLCRMSKSRISDIVYFLDTLDDERTRFDPITEVDAYQEIMGQISTLRPSAIQLLPTLCHKWPHDERPWRDGICAIQWAQRHGQLTKPGILHKRLDLYLDTLRMAQDLGVSFNQHWSMQRMSAEHDAFSKALTARAYSDEPFAWMGERQVRFQASDGVSVRTLNSPAAIAIEGQEMQHCVAAYLSDVVHQRYLVLSLQSKDGRSTLGLRRDKSLNGWVVDQHCAAFNASPPMRHAKSENEIIRIVNRAMPDRKTGSPNRRRTSALLSTDIGQRVDGAWL